MLEMLADHAETVRQATAAAEAKSARVVCAWTRSPALQVAEHASLSTAELTRALHETAPRALAARRATTPELRATPYRLDIPGEHGWTLGYLLDVIHTRDPWLHRVDVCRATGATSFSPPSTTGASSPTSSPTGRPGTGSRSTCC